MSFRRYEAYKDSLEARLGLLPVHWPIVMTKRIATLTYGDSLPQEIRNENGDIPVFGSNGPHARHDVANTEAPAIFIGRKGSCGAINWTDVPSFGIDTVYYVDRRHTRAHLRWLFWALHILGLDAVSQDTGVPGLARETAYEAKLPFPPSEEQAAIAAFLDRETAKIDALVEEQQRLIGLLKEKRQSVISHAVTRGLDPYAPMKDSGTEWLGEVPRHWLVGKIRQFAKLESGHTPSRQHPEYWENCTIPWFSLADVWQIRDGRTDYVYETKELVSELGLANSSARLLPKGTVMLSRTASVGYSAIMGCDMATTQDFANWVCGKTLIPEFLLFVLRGMRGEFDRLMMGSTHQTIYMPDIGKLALAVPPKDEQARIISFLNDETKKIDALTDEAESAVGLLQERRSALISAAVTGKIDVRDAGLVRETEAA